MAWPRRPTNCFEGRDLALTTDFRAVVSEIIVKHLGNANLEDHLSKLFSQAGRVQAIPALKIVPRRRPGSRLRADHERDKGTFILGGAAIGTQLLSRSQGFQRSGES